MLDEELEALFQASVDFIDGKLFQNPKYQTLLKLRLHTHLNLLKGQDPRFSTLMLRQTAWEQLEADLIARHYFEQGYLAGQADR